MKFARLGPLGHETPVAIIEGTKYDISSLTGDITGEFLHDGGELVQGALDAGTLSSVENPEELRVGAPIARPQAVICIGQNYAAHAAESGAQPPSTPIVFMKHPNTVVGPNDTVPLPPGAEKVDWEVELAIVIGRRASYLGSIEEAAAHIGGYTVVDDISERAWQMEQSLGQWSKGKNGESFAPTGPVVVTPDEVDPGNLGLRSWVNGELRQDSTTSDMIFSVEYIVWHLSQYMVLEPGDLICTGTPEGVAFSGRFPYLADGDVVRLEIDGIGTQEHVFRSK
ncbi:fumarylacetoacetate hydrolase family protein [Timonella senegalensis]|uniref:fumarylacetoacetate hydrolase family protein n=1 Tax=Timonella senegalensis TaxID=1465825 RepID=UPI0028B1930C|nr:fumarylacetoacetate hydrolase family protein [Timonella senegalensis]